MNRKLLLALCLLLLPSLLSLARFSKSELKTSSSLPVHNISTGLSYTLIQEAIDANETLSGQTILVDDGTYYENVVVDKSLILTGESRDNTIVDANGTGDAFTLTAPNISLTKFTVANSFMRDTPLYGDILLNQTTNCTIEGVKATNCNYTGVALSNSTKNRISGCEFFGDGSGIVLYNSNQNVISGCECFGNQSSLNQFPQQCGIVLLNSNENVIGDNIVSGVFFGIGLWGYGCNDNVLIGNNVSSCVGNGFDIVGFDNNITCNHIWNNGNGVLFDHASGNIVDDNDVSNSTMSGVHIGWTAANNTILENTIHTNQYGVFIEWNSGNNNLFYHNNFVNNNVQDLSTSGSLSTWDNGYPSGGNYWSDYTGTDIFSGLYQNVSGSDGIGDKAYSINACDRYPLMAPFSDFNATPEYHVQTISNFTISDFQFNGTAISFNVTDGNGTIGFCRICIPTALINWTLRVFVNGTEVRYTLLPGSNSTQSYLYFTYHYSTQHVIIIPEFPSFLTLSLFLITTLFSALIRKKRKQTPSSISQLRSNAITKPSFQSHH
jgi:parallel beta-helix repeat protein